MHYLEEMVILYNIFSKIFYGFKNDRECLLECIILMFFCCFYDKNVILHSFI